MQPVPHTGDDQVATFTFDDAVDYCDELDDTAPPGPWHAIVVADGHGSIVRKTMLQGVFTIDHAVGWAMGFHDSQPVATVLFVSAVEHDLIVPDALDLWEFDRLGTVVRLLGFELRDWILTNGEMVRSLAYTSNPPSAWLSDPLPARTEQLKQVDPGLVWE